MYSGEEIETKPETKSISKFLKWMGIMAIAAVPVVLILKKLRTEQSGTPDEDNGDIFADELSQ